jgi:prophage DNA circulation protein
MAWTDRLRPEITFISPEKHTFKALWRGNDISAEKRLGRHAYPGLNWEVIQDMGMNSTDVPLTIYFDGPDNDRKAWDFEAALYESGVWTVIHPVRGLLRLQLVSYKLAIEPVESGNVTVCETEWVEPAEDEEVAAITDPAAEVEAAVEAVNKFTFQDLKAMVQKAVSQTKRIADDVKTGVMKVKSAARGIMYAPDKMINAIQSQINELSNEAYMDMASVAGAVINLIQAPGLMLGSVSSKIAMFANLGRRIMVGLPNAATYSANQVNAALTGQLFLNAITAGMGKAIISDAPETRREALSVLAEYRKFAAEAQAALDEAAELTADNRIERQFIARASSGEAVATLNAAVARYLMRSLYDLKIERRLVLDRPRAPLEIAITEYKASGEQADYYYEMFCRTNGLHCKDLLLLQTGREVVIYG